MRRGKWLRGAALVALAALAVLQAWADTAPVVLKTTEFGKGPTVVLLHTVGSQRMVWMPTARKLLANYHVVMVDLPGHGDSALPDPFSLAACAEALDQVLAKQKADSTVLVAHRFGALIALQELQAHPDRVKGLIVIDAATKTPVPVSEQQQQYFLQALDEHYDEMLKSMMMGQGKDSVEARELHATAMGVPAATIKAYFRAALNVDASASVKTLRAPLLFVGSGQVLPAAADWALAGKRLGYDDPAAVATRRVPDSGALIMKQQPDSLAAVIRDFTTQVLAAKK